MIDHRRPVRGRAGLRRARWRVAACALVMLVAPHASATGQAVTPVQRLPNPRAAETRAPYVRREWTVATGLPQGTVTASVVDSAGFVWLATNAGLVRFDGRGLRTFAGDEIPALVTNRVQWVTRGSGASVILVTPEGRLARLVGGRVAGEQPPPLPAPGWFLEHDPAGQLYATTSRGMFRLVPGRGWVSTTLPLHTENVHRIRFADDGTTYLIDNVGVVVIAGDGRATRISEPGVTDLVVDARGVWISGEHGLFWLARTGGPRHYAPAPVARSVVRKIARHPDGSLWVAGDLGIWRLCDSVACPGTRRESLTPIDTAAATHREVTSFTFPGEDVVLVGTQSAGFVAYTQRAVVPLRMPAAVQGASVHHLTIGPDGSLWIGPSPCNGLRRALPDSLVLYRKPALGLHADCVRSLFTGRDGIVYLGQSGELSLVRPDGTLLRSYAAADGLPTSSIGPLFQDRRGQVWFGTESGQVGHLTRDGRIAFDPDLALSDMPVWHFAEDSTGTLWVAGVGVLRSRDANGHVKTYGQAEGVPRGQVRVLEADADGSLWIGTYGGGLANMRNGRVTRIPAAAGIRERSFSALVRDRAGRFWLSGNGGITVVAVDEVRAFLRGETNVIDANVIGPSEDVPEANGGHPAAATLRDGRIAFATIGGVMLVNPDSVQPHTAPLLVDEIRVGDVPVPTSRSTIGGVAGEPLLVRFSAPSFGRSAMGQFRVRLSSEGNTWHDLAPDLTLRYAGLTAGTHHLYVRRPVAGGGMRTEEILTVQIDPRWFETTIARLLALLLSLTALVAILILHQQNVRGRLANEIRTLEARRQADEERARYERELAHVARRATAGELATSLAHEVGQPLTAMVGNAEAGRRLLAHAAPDMALIDTVLADIVREGRRAANVIRELRSFLRRGQPNQTQLDLSTTTEECLVLIRSQFQDAGIRLTSNLAPDLPPVLGEPVLLQQVILNLLTNAADALRGLPPGARVVHLRTRASHAGVRLTISDSGDGVPEDMRRRIFEAFHTTKPDGMGVGLAICRTIIDAHRGKLQVRQGPMGGAVFSFVLPTAVSAE